MNLENTSNNYRIGFYAGTVGLLTTFTTIPSVSNSLKNLEPNMTKSAHAKPKSDLNSLEERLNLPNTSNSENYRTPFADSMISKFDILYQYKENRKMSFVYSMISKFDILYQYENPPIDDIQWTKDFIKDFASYINHGIHYLDMADTKIDEDDYISIKWKKSDRSLYFEIKDKCIYFTKLWFQDNQLISSDGTLTKEIYKETWKWLINGN